MRNITARSNPTFRDLRQLAHSARERRKQGRTILDGMHLVAAWSDRFGLPERLVLSESGLGRAEIRQWLAAHPRAEALVLADALFAEVSPVSTPTGILACVPIPSRARMPDPAGTSLVLLEGIQDAGNLGGLLRTAAAAGIGDVFLDPACAQAWAPRTLRAAMGAHFSLRIHEYADLIQVLNDFSGLSIATTPSASASLHELDLRGPLAWLFGSEGQGLSEPLAARAGVRARIPLAAQSESLNVAAACAICLFEEVRQKQARQGSPP